MSNFAIETPEELIKLCNSEVIAKGWYTYHKCCDDTLCYLDSQFGYKITCKFKFLREALTILTKPKSDTISVFKPDMYLKIPRKLWDAIDKKCENFDIDTNKYLERWMCRLADDSDKLGNIKLTVEVPHDVRAGDRLNIVLPDCTLVWGGRKK